MAHHDHDATTTRAALELLTEHGFEGMASALQLLLDEAMKLERSAWIGAAPYERNSERRAYANQHHALTVQYFEVLRHCAVRTELIDEEEVLFIPYDVPDVGCGGQVMSY